MVSVYVCMYVIMYVCLFVCLRVYIYISQTEAKRFNIGVV